jgi:hypothetical protein
VCVPGGIFISYRRQETSHLAGRLYDRLANRFGDDQVFMDLVLNQYKQVKALTHSRLANVIGCPPSRSPVTDS